MGHYNNNTQRALLASTANHYYVELTTLFDLARIPILAPAHEIQLRVYMDSLANSVNVSTLTGTPISTITASNLIAKVSRLNTNEANKYITQISRSPQHYLFNETRYATFNVAAGTAATNLILASITGKAAYLYFTVRATNALIDSNEWLYDPIASFSILDSSSSNIIGGQDVSSSLVLLNLCKEWTKSSYSTESIATGAAVGSYAYLYSFSQDPISSAKTAANYGYFQFTGVEQLKINFVSTLTQAVQVDVYAMIESVLEVSPTYTKKFNL
jgi:hypothetical protein